MSKKQESLNLSFIKKDKDGNSQLSKRLRDKIKRYQKGVLKSLGIADIEECNKYNIPSKDNQNNPSIQPDMACNGLALEDKCRFDILSKIQQACPMMDPKIWSAEPNMLEPCDWDKYKKYFMICYTHGLIDKTNRYVTASNYTSLYNECKKYGLSLEAAEYLYEFNGKKENSKLGDKSIFCTNLAGCNSKSSCFPAAPKNDFFDKPIDYTKACTFQNLMNAKYKLKPIADAEKPYSNEKRDEIFKSIGMETYKIDKRTYILIYTLSIIIFLILMRLISKV